MGHDAHFLTRLDRVKSSHVEMGLNLYRDHELVKYLWQNAKVPESADRMAISMDHPQSGPFIVVHRSGAFITVLKEGMSPGPLPILTLAQFTALKAKHQTQRDRQTRVSEAISTESELHRLLRRIADGSHTMPREDFESLSTLQPFMGGAFYITFIGEGLKLENNRSTLINVLGKRATEASLLGQWRGVFALGHMIILSGLEGGVDGLEMLPNELASVGTTFCHFATDQHVLGLALRGLWAAAKFGPPLLAALRPFLTTDDFDRFCDAVFSTTAVGLAHPSRRAEVRGIVAGALNKPESQDPRKQAILRTAVDVLDGHGETLDALLARGREACVAASVRAPPQSPYHFARPEDVPDALARTAVLDAHDDWLVDGSADRLLRMLPEVVRVQAADFYFPRAYARIFHTPWTRETMLGWLSRFPKDTGPPVRAEATAGRNDPCPCGSGKKYKKCHGA